MKPRVGFHLAADNGAGSSGTTSFSVKQSGSPVQRNFSPAIRSFGLPSQTKTINARELEPARRRQIHQEETYDSIFVIAFFVVQHSGVVSVLKDDEFMRGRRDPE